MASPQKLTTALRSSIPPCTVHHFSGLRKLLSPKTPANKVLSRNNVHEHRESQIPMFNIDTPNRIKILEDGLSSSNRPSNNSLLGAGAYGTVYKASYRGNQVAAKLVETKRYTNEAVKAEKHAAYLRHANIVKILAIETGPCLSLIAMELCGTSLQDYLEETELSKEERVRIVINITRALQFCHRAGIIHADVKPRNVLIARDGQPKLTDFGSSILIGQSWEIQEIRGTPGYIAPEILKGGIITPAADIYSLGILAWQMLSRTAPFAGLHVHAIIYLSAKGTRPADEHLHDGVKGQYKMLYRNMWLQNKMSRPSTEWIIDKANLLISN